MRPEYVYLIRQGTSSKYKIGYSNNPTARLNTLQTGNAEKLSLVIAVPHHEASQKENELKFRWRGLTVNREWFLFDIPYIGQVICDYFDLAIDFAQFQINTNSEKTKEWAAFKKSVTLEKHELQNAMLKRSELISQQFNQHCEITNSLFRSFESLTNVLDVVSKVY